MKPGRKKALLWTSIVVFLVVGFFVEEHYRGKWSLRAWQKRMIAQGEKFVIEDCLPSTPPAGDNGFGELAAAGGRLSGNAVYQVTPQTFHHIAPGRVIVTSALTEWKRNASGRSDNTNIAWPVLEAALSAYEEPLADARAALRKRVLDAHLPYRFGFNITLPHLARFKQLGQHLNAATARDLHRGRLDEALENIESMLSLVRATHDERLVISQLVRRSIATIAMGATWQALQTPDWNETQLARLQQAWQSIDFILPMTRALEMERAIGCLSFGQMRVSLDHAVNTLGLWAAGSGAASTNAFRSVDDVVQYFEEHQEEILARNFYLPVWRFAWSYQDELLYGELLQTLIASGRAAANLKSLAPADTAERHFHQRLDRLTGVHRMRFLVTSQGLPGLEHSVSRSVVFEAQKELVIAAVALARFHLRHNRLPPALSALVPEFLPEEPRDYCAGQAMRYRLTEDGGFLLYSVGSDGRDDAGNPNPVEPHSTRFSFSNARDLVWPRPATAAETAAFATAQQKKNSRASGQ